MFDVMYGLKKQFVATADLSHTGPINRTTAHFLHREGRPSSNDIIPQGVHSIEPGIRYQANYLSSSIFSHTSPIHLSNVQNCPPPKYTKSIEWTRSIKLQGCSRDEGPQSDIQVRWNARLWLFWVVLLATIYIVSLVYPIPTVNSAKQPSLVTICMLPVGGSLLGKCKWMKSVLSSPGRSQNDEIGHTGTKRKKTACMPGCIYLYIADCHKRAHLHYYISCLTIYHRWCSQDQNEHRLFPMTVPFRCVNRFPVTADTLLSLRDTLELLRYK